MDNMNLPDIFKEIREQNSIYSNVSKAIEQNNRRANEQLATIGEETRERNKLQDNANQATIESKELLKEIAENTAYLKILVEINRETKLNGDELNYIMRAIYDVSKANNKSEADGLFSKALSAINDSGEVVGNIANLTNLLMGIYTVVMTMI